MISAVVLTRNEEISLEKCLKSLSFCDEVIVIDDFSTDKTRQIAHLLGAKVIKKALHDDFASQRNLGLSKAKGDWVLFVDADEEVTPELSKEIIQKINQKGIEGYYVKRRDFIFGKWIRHGETGNICLLRLVKKGSGKWVHPVHEIFEMKGKKSLLSCPLLHYPHQDVAQFINEINNYSSIRAIELYREGKKIIGLDIIAYPFVKFLINYLFRLGFLDGTAGLLVAVFMSFHSFLVRTKLWLKQQHNL